jgi:ribosomal protein L16 Arg81 hydroxylase
MPNDFLQELSLRTLIAPVDKSDFLTRYWEQEPLIVHRKCPGYYGDLFTLQDFDLAMTRSPSYVKTADATRKDPPRSLPGGSAAGLDAALAEMRSGSTLILDAWHRHNENLALLCRLIGAEFGHLFQANLYLTPANGKGFAAHWDNHDVFVLQVVGSKHWKIEKERRAFPHRNENIATEGRELRGELRSFTLEQGDIVYIPRGFVHAAECGNEPSLHITFGIAPTTVSDLMQVILKAAFQRHQHLRAALPPGHLRGDSRPLVKIVTNAL